MTNVGEKRLTTKQEQFLKALLLNPTVRQAARAAGVAERSGYRWLKQHPAFKEAFRARKEAAISQASAVLADAATTAADVLLAVAADTAAPSNARVAASGKILDVAFRAHELEIVEERLDAVEAALAGIAPTPRGVGK